MKSRFKITLLWAAQLVVLVAFSQNEVELKADGMKRGVYLSFHEFKLNNPGVSDSITIESKPRKHELWKTTNDYVVRHAENGRKVKHVWGFSDGKHSFIRHQEEYFQISVEDGQFVFTGFNWINHNATVGAAIIGGAIGGAIAASAALADAKNNPTQFIIDMTDGAISRLKVSEEAVKTGEAKGRLVIYRLSKKEQAQPFQLMIEDTLNGMLEMDSYQNFDILLKPQPAKVCFGDGFQTCITVELNPNETTYLQAINSEKEASPIVEEVSQTDGEYYVYKLKKAAKKRD